jgi:hypothetical protein
MDPRVFLDVFEKRKICCLLPGIGPPIVQPIASALKYNNNNNNNNNNNKTNNNNNNNNKIFNCKWAVARWQWL